MKLKHIVTPINKGAQIQHRLMLGKHAIAEGLERPGTEAEHHLDACFTVYVDYVRALEQAQDEHPKKKQAQGTLALGPA